MTSSPFHGALCLDTTPAATAPLIKVPRLERSRLLCSTAVIPASTSVSSRGPASNLAWAGRVRIGALTDFTHDKTAVFRAVVATSNDARPTTNDGGPLTDPAGDGGHEPATARGPRLRGGQTANRLRSGK